MARQGVGSVLWGPEVMLLCLVHFGISCTGNVLAINIQLCQPKSQCLWFIVPAATQDISHKQAMDQTTVRLLLIFYDCYKFYTTAVTIIRLL